MKHVSRVFLFFLLPFLPSCVSIMQDGAIINAEYDVDNADYASALSNLNDAETYGPLYGENRRKFLYFKGKCLTALGRAKEGAYYHKLLLKEFPYSREADLVRKSGVSASTPSTAPSAPPPQASATSEKKQDLPWDASAPKKSDGGGAKKMPWD